MQIQDSQVVSHDVLTQRKWTYIDDAQLRVLKSENPGNLDVFFEIDPLSFLTHVFMEIVTVVMHLDPLIIFYVCPVVLKNLVNTVHSGLSL